MGLKEWLVPHESRFFDLLEAEAFNLVRGADALLDLLNDYARVREKARAIKEIEHTGDEIVHEIYEALNRTFVTPIDREDIQALASRMDDVMDMVYAAALRFDLYEVTAPTPTMVELGGVIKRSVDEIARSVGLINDMKRADEIERSSVEINRLENVADDLMNQGVADLFKKADPLTVIKFKEIYEKLEQATDACEDVANTLSDIVAKNR